MLRLKKNSIWFMNQKKSSFKLGDPPHYFWICQDLRAIILQPHYKGDPPTTLLDKCGDPYIVEHNPRIHDPDDVFPKCLVKITHAGERKSWKKKFLFLFMGWKKKPFVFNCLWKWCFSL